MLNSGLLVPVNLTVYGKIAMQALIFMLVCLPEPPGGIHPWGPGPLGPLA